MDIELATNEDIINELKNRPNLAHMLFVLNEAKKIDLVINGDFIYLLTLLATATKWVADSENKQPQEILQMLSIYFTGSA